MLAFFSRYVLELLKPFKNLNKSLQILKGQLHETRSAGMVIG